MKNLLIVTQKVDQNDQLLGFFIDWINKFANKFEKIIVLCLEKGEFALSKNVEVFSLGKDRGASKIGRLFNFYKYVLQARKEYDAVFVHMNAVWVILGTWLWHILRKKVFFWYAHKTITWKHRLAEKFADVVFTSTPEGFRLPSKKVVVVGQGIDMNKFKPDLIKRPKQFSILSVGRISPIKNYDTLIEAAKILDDDNFDFSITIIGEPVFPEDKKYERKLKNKIKGLNLEHRFKFLGKIINKELPKYYQSHHLYVNLSKTGSLDKTIVEAMACGLNVLSSNDAARKFLPEELVVSGDNAYELASKIKEVANKDYGDKLREYVMENHSLDRLINKITNAINL